MLCIISLLGTYSSSPPPPFKKIFFIPESQQKNTISKDVCAGGLLMDDRWLSLFILFRLVFYSMFPHVYTKNTQQRIPHHRRKKLKCSHHFKSSGCCWVLLITSYCVRSTLIISRPLSPYVHDALR